LSSTIPIELGDSPEEIEEVSAVSAVELCYQTCIDEDELGPVAFCIEGGQLGSPCSSVAAVRSKARAHLGGDVFAVFYFRSVLRGEKVDMGEERGLRGRFEETDHYIAWVQIRVDEVIYY
jgi:hypothetical protein